MPESNVPKVNVERYSKKKRPRKKRGFSIELSERRYNVYFESYNDRVVICYIKDHWYIYKGVAVCNIDSGDTFNEQIGMEIAFRRAFGKLKNDLFLESERYYTLLANIEEGLDYRFNKLLFSDKLTTKPYAPKEK